MQSLPEFLPLPVSGKPRHAEPSELNCLPLLSYSEVAVNCFCV